MPEQIIVFSDVIILSDSDYDDGLHGDKISELLASLMKKLAN